MSAAASLSAAPFTNAEKADIRRFCGYPPYGAGASGFQSWRFFQAYGLLEYRLDNMAAAEIQNIRLKLSDCYGLETAALGAGDRLSTAQAAVWTRNPAEVRERLGLFNAWRRMLCNLVGVPAGPDLGDPGLRVVV